MKITKIVNPLYPTEQELETGTQWTNGKWTPGFCIRILMNGDLQIALSEEMQEELDGIYSDVDHRYETAWYKIMDELSFGDSMTGGDNWETCADLGNNMEWGGLTSSPGILKQVWYADESEGDIDYITSPAWWFPNHQIENPLETLIEKGEVIFQWEGNA